MSESESAGDLRWAAALSCMNWPGAGPRLPLRHQSRECMGRVWRRAGAESARGPRVYVGSKLFFPSAVTAVLSAPEPQRNGQILTTNADDRGLPCVSSSVSLHCVESIVVAVELVALQPGPAARPCSRYISPAGWPTMTGQALTWAEGLGLQHCLSEVRPASHTGP
jgi:hypothetical protein